MPRDSATPEERERKNIDKETMACLMGKAVERKTSEGRRKKEGKKKEKKRRRENQSARLAVFMRPSDSLPSPTACQ